MKMLIGILFVSITIASCKEPFVLDSISYNRTLVVEAQLTNELKNHKVILSYTSPVDLAASIPETGATVRILDGENQEIVLTESPLGTYQTPVMSGVRGQSYTLYIEVANGEKYQSQTVVQKGVSEIDTVSARFIVNDANLDGLEFSVSAHSDDPKVSNFYRWEWIETYEINTPFPSRYEWVGGRMPVLRTNQVGNCWPTVQSGTINVKSSSGFNENRIINSPIHFVQNGSQKLRSKYSLLVRQYSLDSEAFTYWRTINELLSRQGSLADIQPGNLPGNVFNENGKRVLGYFDASDVSTYRVFIDPDDFESDGLRTTNPLFGCALGQYIVPTDSLAIFFRGTDRGTYVIYDDVDASPNNRAGWILVRKKCGDCTESGTNIKPEYWE
ncbi:MAG: DUF4249 domain-containing protein [Cyclobacteriaceae bacterium]